MAYYPEHWPTERWACDADLMQSAGVHFVRMGEFAWHKMQPAEDHFDFDWLEKAIKLFASRGIKTVLGTPTAAYPPWLHAKYSDLHQMRSDGTVKEFGQRQDVCKNHPGYRNAARNITEELSRKFREHPDVIAWQIDNELGSRGTARCFCPYCQEAFRKWLGKKFAGDINALNQAWGTVFWSQTYNSFDEISIPRDTTDMHHVEGQNPGLGLNFLEFSSRTQVDFLEEHRGLIKKYNPHTPVTHNFLVHFLAKRFTIDYYKLAENLDMVSWDNYPYFELRGRDAAPSPMNCDLMRGLKKKNYWVMEQAAGPCGWNTFAPTPEPGRMRLWSYQVIAKGGDAVCFFRWRSCLFGTEQYCHGILPHHGKPDRRYDELSRFGSEIRKISPELDGSIVHNNIAFLFDYPAYWSFEIQPHISRSEYGYYQLIQRGNTLLASSGIGSDIISYDDNFDAYAILVASSVHLCNKNLAEKFEDYVRRGGTLILGPRSGVKNTENTIIPEIPPGFFRRLTGCSVAEYDSFEMKDEPTVGLSDSQGNRFSGYAIAEVLEQDDDTEVLLRYASNYYAGKPAAVMHRFGNGCCIYIGTIPDDSCLTGLSKKIPDPGIIEYYKNLPPGVEWVSRRKEDQIFRFYLNHNSREVVLTLIKGGRELLSRTDAEHEIRIPPLGLAIVKEKK